jgi:elongation factor P--beta-lysine ligase
MIAPAALADPYGDSFQSIAVWRQQDAVFGAEKQRDLVTSFDARTFAVRLHYRNAAFDSLANIVKFRAHVDDADDFTIQQIFSGFAGFDLRMRNRDSLRSDADPPLAGQRPSLAAPIVRPRNQLVRPMNEATKAVWGRI